MFACGWAYKRGRGLTIGILRFLRNFIKRLAFLLHCKMMKVLNDSISDLQSEGFNLKLESERSTCGSSFGLCGSYLSELLKLNNNLPLSLIRFHKKFILVVQIFRAS